MRLLTGQCDQTRRVHFQKSLVVKKRTNAFDDLASPFDVLEIHLADQIGKERHESSALDGVGKLALVPLTYTGTLAWHNFAERRQIALQGIGVLVVDLFRIHLTKMTLSINMLMFLHKVKREYLRL